MLSEAELTEYLAEIRKQVCSRCIERPPGGPPCAPLGKVCGIELHLPQIITAIREVKSNWLEDYLENDRAKVCAFCPHLHSSICPCPMDYLGALLVEAVETVDERKDREKQLIG
jgi:hypothetical protein